MVHFLTSIFARIWAVWVFIVFVVTMLMVWLVLFLFNHRKEYGKTRFFQLTSRIWMRTLFFLCGYRIHFFGRENVPRNETFIFVCNHRSFLDIFIMTPFIPLVNKTIGKKEFMNIPFLSRIYGSGTVLVDRKSMTSKQKSFQDMKQVLAGGCSMCIYPEGTRNKGSDALLPFQRGAFLLAKETQKSMIPIVIIGTDKGLSAQKLLYALPTKIEVYFLPPEPVNTHINDDELRQRIWTKMNECYNAKTV